MWIWTVIVVVEAFEGLFVEGSHGKMYLAIVIVPVKIGFILFFSSVVHKDIVVAFESVDEMVGIITRGVLDIKFVINESELGRTCVMFPKSRKDVALTVSSIIEALFEEAVSKAVCLGQAILTMVANIYPPIRSGLSWRIYSCIISSRM